MYTAAKEGFQRCKNRSADVCFPPLFSSVFPFIDLTDGRE